MRHAGGLRGECREVAARHLGDVRLRLLDARRRDMVLVLAPPVRRGAVVSRRGERVEVKLASSFETPERADSGRSSQEFVVGAFPANTISAKMGEPAPEEPHSHTAPVIHMSVILIYGRDQRLLETRSWVLEHAGYRVLQAANLAEAETHARAEPVDVAVLCHTLSSDESLLALRALRRLQPGTRRMVLTAGATSVVHGEEEAVFSAYDGPLGLLRAVGRLASQADAR